MNKGRLLMISTDRLIFVEGSSVRARQIEYAKEWDQVHIIVFKTKNKGQDGAVKISSDKVEGFDEAKLSESNKISANCFVYSTDSISKFFYHFDAISIGKKIIEENGITEITCQDSSLTAMVGSSLKATFKIPLEIQIHTDIGSPYFARTISNKIRLVMARKYLLKADKIRVVSKRIQEYVEGLLKQKISNQSDRPTIELRPIAVDVESIKRAPITVDLHKKYSQFKKIVLMASRLEKEKNIGLAIEAWKKAAKLIPEAGLVIVGSGSEGTKLNASIASEKLANSIVIENWVDKLTLASYYKTADIFLVTSFFEGYGMTLVEANIAGCPIISTDVGVAREIGATISQFDSNDLAAKIVAQLHKAVNQ